MEFYDKIIEQIKRNKLMNFEKDFVVAQLCVINNKPYEEMKEIVDNLESLGELDFEKRRVGKVNGDIDPSLDMESNIDKAYKILARKDARAKKNSKRVRGTIDRTQAGYAFLIPDDETMEDIFIAEKDLNGAMNKDIVVVETKKTGGRKQEGKVVQVVERTNNRIVGRIKLNKHNALVSPDDVKFGADILIPINKVLNANQGDKVVVKIEKYNSGKKNPEGVVLEVLGPPDKIETEVLSLIRSYDLYETFSKNVQKIASEMPTEIDLKKYKDRKDLTNEILFTIDGEDSRDLDDAVGLKINKAGNRVLTVAIADVGEYVTYNSPIDKEAFQRGTSVYFPGLVLPMLPRELSNGICSLNEGVNRLSLTVDVEYDANANVISSNFYESVIRSSKRFTYTTVQKILEGDEKARSENSKFVPILLEMAKLSKQLSKIRSKMGSLELNIPEVFVELDELGGVANISKRIQDESHKLIETFMVAGNEQIAKFFYDKKLPFVYRVHEKPDQEKMESFLRFIKKLCVQTKVNAENIKPIELQKILNDVKGTDAEFAVNKICLRSMQKAKYNPICLGHFGLALKYYCHFTSPIRRYPDLTIHRIIKDYLHGNLIDRKLAETKRFVLVSAMNSTEREIVADKVERDVDDLYKAYYMQSHIGEEFDAVVCSVTKYGVYVQLENSIEGLVSIADLPDDNYEYIEEELTLKGGRSSFCIGRKLRVKLANANIITRNIDFVLA